LIFVVDPVVVVVDVVADPIFVAPVPVPLLILVDAEPVGLKLIPPTPEGVNCKEKVEAGCKFKFPEVVPRFIVEAVILAEVIEVNVGLMGFPA